MQHKEVVLSVMMQLFKSRYYFLARSLQTLNCTLLETLRKRQTAPSDYHYYIFPSLDEIKTIATLRKPNVYNFIHRIWIAYKEICCDCFCESYLGTGIYI